MSNDTEMVELTFECEAQASVQWKVQAGTLTEGLNAPFAVTLHLATDNMDAEPVQLLGQPATLTISRASTMRQVTGIIADVSEGSTHPEMVTTVITVRPALEALRHRVNTKIFQEMTVPDILEQVLGEGLGAYDRSVDNRLERTYPTCEFRTQYDESDLDFCLRLMEEEGIVTWFEFEGETETMILADSADAYGQIESIHSAILQFTLDEGQVGGHEYVREFHGGSQIVPTKMATRHFDWTHPSVPIEGENTDAVEGERPNGALIEPEREVYEHDHDALTLHEYDGQAFGANDVDDQVQIRREEQAWDSHVCEGESTVMGMTIGSILELSGHTRPEFDGRYLAVSVTHHFDEDGTNYTNLFECIPEDVPFRPTRETPKPRIPSIQTATVTGPSGEEIHTDTHGRIKVQFHWDREGQNDEHSSCWVRVMQPWAGAGWGFVFIPRIGMEVVVKFVNGDPDLPVVIGSVYNGEHPPPYSLPDEKTKSTIKTESSLGGGGFNEWRFEDLAGEEEIYTHAQKDYNEVVENDHTTTVHHDQTNTVDNNQTQEIGANQTEHVGANQEMTVDGDRTTHIVGNFSETVDGSETRTVSSGATETIDAGETRTITGGMTETISGGREQTINGDSTETITGALTQTVVGGAKITTPASYEINAAGGVTIIAPGGMTIIAPGGHQLIAPGGQTTVDFGFEKSGVQWHNSFGFSFGHNMFKMENCVLVESFVGFQLETGLIKVGNLNIDLGGEPNLIKQGVVAIRQKGIKAAFKGIFKK